MADFQQIYVDPSIAGNSGTGTSVDPYGDLQYALDTMTRDGTNGDQINIKSGTDEILAAVLSLTTYTAISSPSTNNPLIFKGYTTTVNDGGDPENYGIDANSNAIHLSTVFDAIWFVDLKLHNFGASVTPLRFDNASGLINCVITNGTTTGSTIQADSNFSMVNCVLTDVVGGVTTLTYANILRNIFIDGTTNSFGGSAVVTNSTYSRQDSNIVAISSINTDAFRVGSLCYAVHNSIFCSGASTAAGFDSVAGVDMMEISNNLIEGFSGTGGHGINLSGFHYINHGNAIYNCDTEIANTVDSTLFPTSALVTSTNETLLASPFTNPTTSLSTADFTRVDTGAVKEGAQPPKIGINS